MDPNFVQHSVADLSTRFAGLLVFLLGFSVFMFGALGVIYKTRLYNKLIGKGFKDADGVEHPSRYFKNSDPRAWISLAVGVCTAVALNLNFSFYLLGITDNQYIRALPTMDELGIFTPFAGGFTIFCMQVLTGLALGGGPAVFVNMGKTFASARDSIMERINGKK